MEENFAPIGQIHEIKHYGLGKTSRLPQLPPSGRLTKKPPVIKPEELPETTMRRILQASKLQDSAEYKSIAEYLATYQRQGDYRRWDEFRNKIPLELLKIWGDILIECRRNGFCLPRAENNQIMWRQVISTNKIRNGDLCTMCDRDCKRRKAIDSGDAKQRKMIDPKYQEQKPCWDHRQPGEEG